MTEKKTNEEDTKILDEIASRFLGIQIDHYVQNYSTTPESIAIDDRAVQMWPKYINYRLRMDQIIRMFTPRDIVDFASTLATWRNEWKHVEVLPLEHYLAREEDDDKRVELARSLRPYYDSTYHGGYMDMVEEYIKTNQPVARAFGLYVAIVTFTQKAKDVLDEHYIKVQKEYLRHGSCPEEVRHQYHNLCKMLEEEDDQPTRPQDLQSCWTLP